MLTHLSLFSGIGELDLAAEMAGFVTVGMCEWADYPTKILERHWPDVPRWRDIRTLTGESFYERTGLRTVDVVSGGFPCQPFSIAGKRGGKDDDRYLWPEMLRVIHEIRPSWVLGENVLGIVNLALDTVLSDLAEEGYEGQAFVIPACSVDAPHRRDRVAILANSDSAGLQGCEQHRAPDQGGRRPEPHGPAAECCETVLHTNRERLEKRDGERVGRQEEHKEPKQTDCQNIRGRIIDGRTQWATEPDVGRVAHGVPNRVDRIKCLGNAVVPQQFYPFFAAIAEIERSKEEP